jgi:SH3-like domain-containing protein
MRLGILTALGIGVVLAVAGVATAEKVTTNQRAELFARPGEASRVLMKLKEGQAMTFLEREGRWLKVRVKGRTGYIPRSKIDEDRSDRINRNTRRRPFVDGRSTERGWAGGAPDDRVGADAVDDDDDRGRDDDDDDRDDDRGRGDDDDDDRGRGDDDDDDDDDDRRSSRDDDDDDRGDDDDDDDDRGRRGDDDDDDDDDRGRRDDDEEERETVRVTAKKVALYERPSKSSEMLGHARKGDEFFFMREDGNWSMIENDEGDAVWVKSSSLSRDDGGGGAGERSRASKREMIGMAGLGVKMVGQKLKTPMAMNDNPPDNYNLGTSAVTLQIGGELMYPYGKSYLIGGTLEYAGSRAVPGISYDGSTTGVMFHDVDLRAMGGYDLKNGKGMVAYARLGYHYENMAIANVGDPTKNTAMIPSEIFSAPVIGAALDVTRLTDKLALRVILDTVVIGGKRSQTRNLEDGSSPKVKGAWLTGCLAYKWKKKMTINGAYELTYMNTNFGPQAENSMRHPAGSGTTTRRDLNHSLIVTLGYWF